MSILPSYGKGSHLLLWVGSRVACGNVTVSGTSNFLNYSEIFIVYRQFRNVTSGCIIQPGCPRVQDPCCRVNFTLPLPVSRKVTGEGKELNRSPYMLTIRKSLLLMMLTVI
jgi:hypothetical protein